MQDSSKRESKSKPRMKSICIKRDEIVLCSITGQNVLVQAQTISRYIIYVGEGNSDNLLSVRKKWGALVYSLTTNNPPRGGAKHHRFMCLVPQSKAGEPAGTGAGQATLKLACFILWGAFEQLSLLSPPQPLYELLLCHLLFQAS